MALSPKRLLRILMLHGYRQNEPVFKDKTGGVRKKIKNLVEFVYCEAPNTAPLRTATTQPNLDEVDVAVSENEDKTEAATASASLTTKTTEKAWFAKGVDQTEEERHSFTAQFEKTLDYLDELFATKGPFDGVWGFSQGATVASILSRIAEQNDTCLLEPANGRTNIKFKFVIIAATYKSPNEPELFRFFDTEKKLSMPSLHIIGKNDLIVSSDKSLKFAEEHFSQPEIYLHEFGHFIPRNA